MEPQDLAQSLQKHPFLLDADEDLIKTLTSCASNVVFKEGARLFHQAEDAKLFFLIRSGRVALDPSRRKRSHQNPDRWTG